MAARYPMYFDPTLEAARALAQAPAKFIIYKEMGVSFARDGQTGEIRFKDVDAASVIQSAIDALTEGAIFLKSGIYDIESTLSLKSRVGLIGEGTGYYGRAAILKLADGANVPLLNVKAEDPDGQTKNVVLRNLWLNGNAPNQVAEVDMVDFANARMAVLDDVYFYQSKRDALITYYAWVVNCRFMNNGRYAIWAKADTYIAFCNFASNVFDSAYDSWSNAAIFLGHENCIIGNDIYMTKYGSGISLYNVTRNRIIGNRISHNNWHGIALHLGENNHIIGNLIYNNSARGAGMSGVRVSDTVNNIIALNRCFDDRATKLQDYGIEEFGTSDYNEIVNNNVRENLTAGITTVGANSIVKYNIGYVTENRGTATMPAGSASVTVAHGLAKTPRIALITPHHSDIEDIRVTAKTATNFTVEVTTAPAADRTFDWYAEV